MTHDKFCQDNGLGCGEYFCDEPCICEIVANVRADEREQAAQRVEAALLQQYESIAEVDKIIITAARGGEQA